MGPLMDIAAIEDVTITAAVPIRKIFLRPTVSATLPKISTNMALAIRNAIGTQLSINASICRSRAIDGSATLVDDSMMGVANEFSVIISRTARRTSGVSGELNSMWYSVLKSLEVIDSADSTNGARDRCLVTPWMCAGCPVS